MGEFSISDCCLNCGHRAMKVTPSDRSFRNWDQGILNRERTRRPVHLLFRTPWITCAGKPLSWTCLITAGYGSSYNVELDFTSCFCANAKFLRLFRQFPTRHVSRPANLIPPLRLIAFTRRPTESCSRQLITAPILVKGDV